MEQNKIKDIKIIFNTFILNQLKLLVPSMERLPFVRKQDDHSGELNKANAHLYIVISILLLNTYYNIKHCISFYF